jgi:SSS family solute:Na+ symporter
MLYVIAAVFLLGVLTNGTTPKAGFYGLVIGFVLGMSLLVLKIFSGSLDTEGLLYSVFIKSNWLHYEIYLFFIVLISMVVISSFTKREDPDKIKGLTLGSATPEQIAETKASYNRWDIINSAIIIGIVVIFYLYF